MCAKHHNSPPKPSLGVDNLAVDNVEADDRSHSQGVVDNSHLHRLLDLVVVGNALHKGRKDHRRDDSHRGRGSHTSLGAHTDRRAAGLLGHPHRDPAHHAHMQICRDLARREDPTSWRTSV